VLQAIPGAARSLNRTKIYIVPEIALWPPPQDPITKNRDEEVDKTYRLLNPPRHLGNLDGISPGRERATGAYLRDTVRRLEVTWGARGFLGSWKLDCE
jgi:hypothetical protein